MASAAQREAARIAAGLRRVAAIASTGDVAGAARHARAVRAELARRQEATEAALLERARRGALSVEAARRILVLPNIGPALRVASERIVREANGNG